MKQYDTYCLYKIAFPIKEKLKQRSECSEETTYADIIGVKLLQAEKRDHIKALRRKYV